MKKQHKLLIVLLAVVAILIALLCVFLGNDTKYTVSFYDSDGTLISSEKYKSGEELVLPEDPVKEDYVFMGWILEGEEEPYDFSAENALTVEGDMSFTACYVDGKYTVTFADANGVDIISSKVYHYGDKLELPGDPEKEGYSFVGWVKKGETDIFDFEADGAMTIASDLTFIAKYQVNKYKVTFTDADGNEYKVQTLNYGEAFSVPEGIEKDGFAFKGWALAGQTELYDFEAADARVMGAKDLVFVPIYDKLYTVAGQLVKVDGTGFPSTVTINFGEYAQTVAVSKNGKFTTQIRSGTYPVSVDLSGYKTICNDITVADRDVKIGTVKLIQSLTLDRGWWNGGKLAESGTSATLTFASDANGDSGVEFIVGEAISGAESWKITAKLVGSSTARRGFSIGTTGGGTGTVLIYVDDDAAGFHTWSTYKNENDEVAYRWALSNAAKEAIQSEDGYQLTLVATNIDGAGTGWLTLYVNDIVVLQMENTFTGLGSSGAITSGFKMDLGNCHVALAARGTNTSVTYTDYYYTANSETDLPMGTVKGQLEKLDGTAFPETTVLNFGLIRQTVAVDPDGSFTTEIPAGTYAVTGSAEDVTVAKDTENTVSLKLLQKLTYDRGWWSGGSLTESGISATLNFASDAHGDSGVEYIVGEPINGAESWKISAKLTGSSTARRGFSIGSTGGGTGTVLVYVDDDVAGFHTWSTYQNANGEVAYRWPLSDAAKEAIQSEDGYQLTLVATNIDGAGTGWLTLYVNDIVVLQMENTFTGIGSSNAITDGFVMDLSNCHVALAARGTNTSVTYTDYYYTVNGETDLAIGTVNGQLVKLDGTAYPGTAVLNFGLIRQTVAVDAEGNFTTELPVGTYTVASGVEGYRAAAEDITVVESDINVTIKLLQNLTYDKGWWDVGKLTESGSSATLTFASDAHGDSGVEFKVGDTISGATSWKISAKLTGSSTARRGFSIGTTGGGTSTVLVYVDDDTTGFHTWSTYKNANGEVAYRWPLSDAAKEAIQAEDGYQLTLVATNIDGTGTGWLTLYVNDIIVLQMENTFTADAGQTVMDLGNCHVSLAARGTNTSVTYADYYYTVNGETDLAIGTVNGQLVKLDGTAYPETAVLNFGLIKQTVAVDSDGKFTAKIPVGTYAITSGLEGYRAVAEDVTAAANADTNVTVKLLQNLTYDRGWWNGGTLTESDSSANLIFASDANGDSGVEFIVGEAISGAESWKISAILSGNSTARRGFSIGSTGGGTGTVLIYVDDDVAGFHTWSTYQNANGEVAYRWALSNAAKEAIQSEDGYELTLVATNIDGAGTGWLTLYVNDIVVLQMENTFTGIGSSNAIADGFVMDLSNCHVALAARGTNTSVTYTDYHYTVNSETDLVLSTVNGQLVKLDGTAYPESAVLNFGLIRQNVAVDAEGNFTTELPVGIYAVVSGIEGYRAAAEDVTVAENADTNVTVKLLQNLTYDRGWWSGGSLTESGISATLNFASDAHGDSGVEYIVGEPISGAESWKISAKLNGSSTARRGFSIGSTGGGTGTVLIYVDDDAAGFHTWSTYQNANSEVAYRWPLSDAAKAAIQSEDGYQLTLVATNIDGAGTGWLTLYVNDIVVLQMENTFTGLGSSGAITSGFEMDLGNCHVALAARGTNTSVTYTDYYYTVNGETDLAIGTVNGQLVKLDGTAYPETAVLNFGLIKQTVSVDSDGKFTTELPVGTYAVAYTLDGYRTVAENLTVAEGTENALAIKLLQNLTYDRGWWNGGSLTESGSSATLNFASDAHGDSGVEYIVGEAISGAESWRISAKLTGSSPARRGFSIGSTGGGTGTVMIYVDDDVAGFHTWSTYQNANGEVAYKWALSDAAKAAIQSEDGYQLTLVATNMDGAGTGWLTLYVNDIIVLQMENTFTGLGSSGVITSGFEMDLGNCHVALAARGTNTSVTYTDYYYTVNGETDLAIGNVNGQLVKLDGTAYPETAVLNFGLIKQTVSVDSDGKFTTELPVGTYAVAYTLDGYRTVVEDLVVAEGTENVLVIKLLQNLIKDRPWWNTGTLTESGSSATITFASTAHVDAGTEYTLGDIISGATSWKISAHIEKGATARRGFSIGGTGEGAGEGTIFIYLYDDYAGFHTWATYQNAGGYNYDSWTLSDEAKAAIQAEGGYDLTLLATDIDGANTGWLTLYVNDIVVYRTENTFTGLGSSGAITNGFKLDLGNCTLALTARNGAGTSATFTDYYYQVNAETEEKYNYILNLDIAEDGTVSNGAGAPVLNDYTGPDGTKVVMSDDTLNRPFIRFDGGTQNQASSAYYIPFTKSDESMFKNGFAIEVMFRATQAEAAYTGIIDFAEAGGFDVNFQTINDVHTLIVELGHSTSGYAVIKTPVELNKWYHCVVDFNAEDLRLTVYLNGMQVAQTAVNTGYRGPSFAGNDPHITIGSVATSGTKGLRGFTGDIAIANIHGDSLTFDEVKTLYYQAKPEAEYILNLNIAEDGTVSNGTGTHVLNEHTGTTGTKTVKTDDTIDRKFVSFDGESGANASSTYYVTASSETEAEFADGFAIETMFRATQAVSGTTGIIDHAEAGGFEFCFKTAGDKHTLIVGLGQSAGGYASIETEVELNKWYHCVIDFNANDLKLTVYLNGAQVAQTAVNNGYRGPSFAAANSSYPGSYISIGSKAQSDNYGQDGFTGDIAIANIHADSLNATDVEMLYASVKPE